MVILNKKDKFNIIKGIFDKTTLVTNDYKKILLKQKNI